MVVRKQKKEKEPSISKEEKRQQGSKKVVREVTSVWEKVRRDQL